jgi:hypothetical protein
MCAIVFESGSMSTPEHYGKQCCSPERCSAAPKPQRSKPQGWCLVKHERRVWSYRGHGKFFCRIEAAPNIIFVRHPPILRWHGSLLLVKEG